MMFESGKVLTSREQPTMWYFVQTEAVVRKLDVIAFLRRVATSR